MEPFWWNLAGPSRLLESIIEELRQGRNIALRIDCDLAFDIAGAIRNAIEHLNEWDWQKIDLREIGLGSPIDILWSLVNGDSIEKSEQDITNLLNHSGFQGKVIWIEGLNRDSVAPWVEFFLEYAHACRGVSLLRRTLLCMVLVDELRHAVVRDDVCAVVLSCDKFISRLDILVYSDQIVRDRGLDGLTRQVSVAVIAQLALWDRSLCAYLAAFDISDLLNPQTILIDWATTRGWNTDGRRHRPSKESGSLGVVDGETHTHSAFLAVSDSMSEVDRRIWRGQVGILFPFIEERRIQIIDRIKTQIPLPVITPCDEVFNDYADIEIGLLATLVRDNYSINYDIRKLVATLRHMRNRLAHLEKVSAEVLGSREVCNWKDILER
ncbi:MAG: hypothetical protein IT169_18060 [Bryobacterales bacterium]|nr:hypothetical protein [Bryobacterales bacterium]